MQRLLYFSMGLVVGAGIGYVVTKGYFKKECEAEVASVKETYQKKYASKELAEKNSEMKRVIRENGGAAELYSAASKAYLRYSGGDSEGEKYPNRGPESHNVFQNPPSGEDFGDEMDDFDEEYAESVDGYSPKEDLADEPYLISSLEFENEMPFFDKTALYIYSDGVAVLEDGNDSVVEDISEILGRDAVKMIEDGGQNELYVRNEMRSSDYEVIILNEAYLPDNDPHDDE